MVSPPLAPSHSATHLVLCDYGALGTAYVETDPEAAGRDAIVRDLIAGEYEKPLRVIALYPAGPGPGPVPGKTPPPPPPPGARGEPQLPPRPQPRRGAHSVTGIAPLRRGIGDRNYGA